tara:strand:+ start:8768 stop:9877 length:1110 start_codon:yes stop_codon:yes gene_type:complete
MEKVHELLQPILDDSNDLSKYDTLQLIKENFSEEDYKDVIETLSNYYITAEFEERYIPYDWYLDQMGVNLSFPPLKNSGIYPDIRKKLFILKGLSPLYNVSVESKKIHYIILGDNIFEKLEEIFKKNHDDEKLSRRKELKYLIRFYESIKQNRIEEARQSMSILSYSFDLNYDRTQSYRVMPSDENDFISRKLKYVQDESRELNELVKNFQDFCDKHRAQTKYLIIIQNPILKGIVREINEDTTNDVNIKLNSTNEVLKSAVLKFSDEQIEKYFDNYVDNSNKTELKKIIKKLGYSDSITGKSNEDIQSNLKLFFRSSSKFDSCETLSEIKIPADSTAIIESYLYKKAGGRKTRKKCVTSKYKSKKCLG